MSKLTITLSSGFAIASLAGIFLFCKNSPEVAHANSKTLSSRSHTSPDYSDIWGKGNAPVLVKIEEVEKSQSTVELKGLIRSKLSGLQIEWKLPEGAFIVEGTLDKNADRNTDGSFVEETIKVDISNATGDKPIVFVAYVEKDGERVGHSRVYKWNVSEQEQEHVEKIRTKMKARNSKFVR